MKRLLERKRQREIQREVQKQKSLEEKPKLRVEEKPQAPAKPQQQEKPVQAVKPKKQKVVPIQRVESVPQHKGQCPYVDWYKFNVCAITSCKNYTEETERRCIALDRVRPEGTKVISDAEIHLYKLNNKGLGGRIVQIKRKKAVDRVKCILILHKFISFLRLNKEEGGVFNTPLIQELETLYPLKIRKLGFKNWMWEYLLDAKTWEEFLKDADGDCREYTVQQLLACKPLKFERLVTEFNNPI